VATSDARWGGGPDRSGATEGDNGTRQHTSGTDSEDRPSRQGTLIPQDRSGLGGCAFPHVLRPPYPARFRFLLSLRRAGAIFGQCRTGSYGLPKLAADTLIQNDSSRRRFQCGPSRPGSRDTVSPRTKNQGDILRRSSATGARPKPSSSFLHHDLQDRMGEFQLARTGDQSTGNKLI
jgi:hypothetical protein